MILPYTQLDLLTGYVNQVSLFINRIVFIDAKKSKPNSRVIIEISNSFAQMKTSRLIIRNEDNSYSDSYINLTKEFHSKELKK